MLTVTYADRYMKALYAECRYAESHFAPQLKTRPRFRPVRLQLFGQHSQIRLRLGALAEKTNLKRCKLTDNNAPLH